VIVDKLDANEVRPDLWVGAAPADVSLIGGFDLVGVCCRPPSTWPERGDWVRLSFTDDIQPPSESERTTIALAAEIAQAYGRGHRVLVLCREGKNRSGLVAALAIAAVERCGGNRAMEIVQAARAGALYNWHFQQMLLAIEG